MTIDGVPNSGRGYGLSRSGSFWPAGEYSIHHDDLCHLLLSSAQDNSHRALTMFVSDDRMAMLQAAVATGTAVELTAKAALVSVDATLICERAHIDSLLRLSGNGERAEGDATDLKTIGGLEAFRLCRRLFKSASGMSESDAQAALRARNAALHLALVNRDELRIAVASGVRVVDQLIAEFGAQRDSFWKGHLALVDRLVVEHQAQIEHIVAAKVEAAKDQITRITASLSPELAAAVLAQRSRLLSSSDHEEPVDCPVCGQEAWLICGVEKGKPEAEGYGEWWVVSSTAWPFAFECSVCGLSLEDSELAHFEFPSYIDLEPEMVPLSWDDYEPDWED